MYKPKVSIDAVMIELQLSSKCCNSDQFTFFLAAVDETAKADLKRRLEIFAATHLNEVS